VNFGLTPSQTLGPYFAIGLPWDDGPNAVVPGTPGELRLHGTVYDGAGEPVPDHLIEIWQPDREVRSERLGWREPEVHRGSSNSVAAGPRR
jgi:protocatechuate 3,4-dioxygenase alpha subunit